jgi:hypothetical protein
LSTHPRVIQRRVSKVPKENHVRPEPRNIASVKSNAIAPPTTTIMPILPAPVQKKTSGGDGEIVSCAPDAEIRREL